MPLQISDILTTLPQEVLSKYDFRGAVYKNSATPIEGIVCPDHGVFKQYSGALRKGIGCPVCGAVKRANSKRLSLEEFVARCNEVHNNKYDYTPTVYHKARDHVQVVCPMHGEFRISPIKHLYSGQGCPTCGALKRGVRTDDVAASCAKGSASKKANYKATYEARATAMHGGFYTYNMDTYTGARQKIQIICPKHGAFWCGAFDHASTRMTGCPSCSSHKSKGETEVFNFLSNLVSAESRNRVLLKPKELDIYLPEQKLAIEYCGEYHHSVKSKEDERANRRKHIEKYKACAEQGVRLITLWESEWKDRNYAIRRLLRNAVGKSKGKLMARKCELRKATSAEARAFYDRYHPQGGSGTGEHYALFWKGKMVACMRFVLGANDRGAAAKKRVWTLGRYATRITVAGAASRLFQAFLKEHNPPEVKSFSDNRMFSGGMYEQLGFTLEEDVGEDYVVWSPKIGIRPKPHYQRRVLPKRLEEHGVDDTFDPETDTRTEADMTYLMGCGRLYDCGKKRWVWKHFHSGHPTPEVP